jgi:hypothetical protein
MCAWGPLGAKKRELSNKKNKRTEEKTISITPTSVTCRYSSFSLKGASTEVSAPCGCGCGAATGDGGVGATTGEVVVGTDVAELEGGERAVAAAAAAGAVTRRKNIGAASTVEWAMLTWNFICGERPSEYVTQNRQRQKDIANRTTKYFPAPSHSVK